MASSSNAIVRGASGLEESFSGLGIEQGEPLTDVYAVDSENTYSSGSNGGIWRLLPLGNDRIVTTSYDKNAKLWSLEEEGFSLAEPQVLSRYRREALSVTRLANECFATGSSDGTLDIWDTQTAEKRATLLEGRSSTGFYSVSDLQNGSLATGSCQRPKAFRGTWEHVIKVWDVAKKRALFCLKGHEGAFLG